MPKTKTVVVIPSRYGSSRFPGKPLALIKGVSLIQRVWSIAKCSNADEVIIATEDTRIQEHAQSFGAKVMMTSPNCKTGTDRVAQIAHELNDPDAYYINLQGDAVLTPPWVIDAMISAAQTSHAPILTPARKLSPTQLKKLVEHKQSSPTSGTTVVFDKNHQALYFSKSILPFNRSNDHIDIFKHVGIYAYQQDTLNQITQLPQSPLEKAEQLEQLRALENGLPIQVVEVDYRGRTEGSIDTPNDVAFVEAIISKEGELT